MNSHIQDMNIPGLVVPEGARLEAREQARQTGCVTLPGAGRNEWQLLRAGK
jgi:hypothetical protein